MTTEVSEPHAKWPSRRAWTITIILWLLGASAAEAFVAESGNAGLIAASVSFIFGATLIVAVLLLFVCTASEDECRDGEGAGH